MQNFIGSQHSLNKIWVIGIIFFTLLTGPCVKQQEVDILTVVISKQLYRNSGQDQKILRQTETVAMEIL